MVVYVLSLLGLLACSSEPRVSYDASIAREDCEGSREGVYLSETPLGWSGPVSTFTRTLEAPATGTLWGAYGTTADVRLQLTFDGTARTSRHRAEDDLGLYAGCYDLVRLGATASLEAAPLLSATLSDAVLINVFSEVVRLQGGIEPGTLAGTAAAQTIEPDELGLTMYTLGGSQAPRGWDGELQWSQEIMYSDYITSESEPLGTFEVLLP